MTLDIIFLQDLNNLLSSIMSDVRKGVTRSLVTVHFLNWWGIYTVIHEAKFKNETMPSYICFLNSYFLNLSIEPASDKNT